MSPLLGLLALILLGTEGPPNSDAPLISFSTWMVEMDGLGWREALGRDLQPVARQGGATVWTAPHEALEPLLEKATEKPAGQVVQSPRVTVASQSVSHLAGQTTRKLATIPTRHADGPVDHTAAVASAPESEEVREGFRATMSGRKLDQGVLTKLVVEDSRIAAVHKVTMSETVPAKGHPAAAGSCQLNATVEVPELVQGSVAGEWLIPNDGLLVVSLGAHTVADPQGKAAVRERVMVVEARPVALTDPALARASVTPNFTYTLPLPPDAVPAAVPMPAALRAMPTPAVPSRSLPQPIAADGTPIPLPPLPESPAPPSSLPSSSDPCASPQAPHQKNKEEMKDEPKHDPQSKPASYCDKACAKSEMPCKPMVLNGVLHGTPAGADVKPEIRSEKVEVMYPTEGKVWRIPMGRGNMIEITVRGLYHSIGTARPGEEPTGGAAQPR
ncbi:MAG TPA: hypothetical protein VKP69_11875 [Isosphaeraceae bacterium]|nr:hypothetical protein [Isosphaeraceae bacterium]